MGMKSTRSTTYGLRRTQRKLIGAEFSRLSWVLSWRRKIARSALNYSTKKSPRLYWCLHASMSSTLTVLQIGLRKKARVQYVLLAASLHLSNQLWQLLSFLSVPNAQTQRCSSAHLQRSLDISPSSTTGKSPQSANLNQSEINESPKAKIKPSSTWKRQKKL
jgi:hypothetical protein